MWRTYCSRVAKNAQGRARRSSARSQALPFARHEVRAALPGRLEEPQGDRLGHAHDTGAPPRRAPPRPAAPGLRRRRRSSGTAPRGRRVCGPSACAPRSRSVTPASVKPASRNDEPDLRRVGPRHLAVLGMDRARHDHLGPPGDPLGHQDGLGHGGRALVHGGVAHLHAGELADEGLVLEERLQGPLGDLGLVRRVGGEELARAGRGAR